MSIPVQTSGESNTHGAGRPTESAPPPSRTGGSPLLRVEGLQHTYHSVSGAHLSIEQLDFDVAPGEFTCIVGPSGAGKTTLLRCLAGLQAPTGGTVRLLDQVVDAVPEDIAIVFQDYARSLYPWMRVASNVRFPLIRRGLSKTDCRQRVQESLEAVGLAGTERKYLWELSGGMQQRVAIARALAYRPRLLLMDEPFASVDAQTRAELEDLTLSARHEFNTTILFVTHDIDECVYLADRVLVLSTPPATLIGDLRVALPRPRDQIQTREMDDFVHLRGEIARLIRNGRADSVATGEQAQGSKAIAKERRDGYV